MKELSGYKYTEEEILRGRIVDILALIWWSKTKDGSQNRNRPESIVDRMLGKQEEIKQDFEHDVFNSPDEFFEARRKSLERSAKNG